MNKGRYRGKLAFIILMLLSAFVVAGRLPAAALSSDTAYRACVSEGALVYGPSPAVAAADDGKESLKVEDFEKIFAGEVDPFENFTPEENITSGKSPKFTSGLNVFAAISPVDEKNCSKIIYALQWREKPTFTYDDVLSFYLAGENGGDIAIDVRDYALTVKYAAKSGEYVPEYDEKITGDVYGALAESNRGIKMKKSTSKGVLYAKEIIFTGTVKPAAAGVKVDRAAVYADYEHCIFKGNREKAGKIRLIISAGNEKGEIGRYIAGVDDTSYGVSALAVKYILPVLAAGVIAELIYLVAVKIKGKRDKIG